MQEGGGKHMPALSGGFGRYRELAPAALMKLLHQGWARQAELRCRTHLGDEVLPLGKRTRSWPSGMAPLSALVGRDEAGHTRLRSP